MKPTLLISNHMSAKVRKTLCMYYDLIELADHKALPKPVAAHPDMQLIILDDTAVLTRSLYELNTSLRKAVEDKYIVRFSECEHSSAYPGDVSLNALKLDKHLICRADALDNAVKQICSEKGIEIVSVRQGYSRCSTLFLEDALITADKGIYETVVHLGYDALLITPGHILLEGYDYGFIGGASFYDKDRLQVFFFGDITKHPDFDSIEKILSAHNLKAVSCSDEELTDLGGAVLI